MSGLLKKRFFLIPEYNENALRRKEAGRKTEIYTL